MNAVLVIQPARGGFIVPNFSRPRASHRPMDAATSGAALVGGGDSDSGGVERKRIQKPTEQLNEKGHQLGAPSDVLAVLPSASRYQARPAVTSNQPCGGVLGGMNRPTPSGTPQTGIAAGEAGRMPLPFLENIHICRLCRHPFNPVRVHCPECGLFIPEEGE